ncbi:MAG: gfo/Idh/MocA family oxidoreductase, partial [Flavobacteriia bacterium]|nr:gfo/Idh/MocA family oxidoreductase [Flavobacteriia bacterium]
MLKVGVFGAGHLGKIHIKVIAASPKLELIGYYDPNLDLAQSSDLLKKHKAFQSPEELIHAVDIVDIVSTPQTHFSIAQKAIEAGKHLFIEKPMAATVAEATEIIQLAEQKGVIGQVGHIERFNPAYIALQPFIENPRFIETHRLAEFNPRGTTVSVVLDLMIHDIDIVLSTVKAPIKNIQASGVAVISKSPDICNARIEFENGCIANLTASRVSLKKVRKSRFFQKNASLVVDYLTQQVEILTIKDHDPESAEDLAVVLSNAEGEKKQV